MTSPLLTRLFAQADTLAVADASRTIDGIALRARAEAVAADLGDHGLSPGDAVALFAPPSVEWVAGLLGVLAAGGMAVPLSPLHAAAEHEHVLRTSGARLVLTAGALAAPAGVTALNIEALGTHPRARPAAAIDGQTPALLLFTSGTTGKPKGVVLSHASVAATADALHAAWGWRTDDRLLHVLPLHHTHGVIVALVGALWAGARVTFRAFDARGTWDALAEATVFMAVPTIYAKLMEAFRAAPEIDRARWRTAAGGLRLATSGSAALPASMHAAFREATGQTLLERYGMTEIGMALSNPLDGPRVPGAVGLPLPGVHVDVVGDDGRPVSDGTAGELRVRSPQMFSGYLGDAEATAAAFDEDGRFRTGDTGVRDDAGVFRLLGRTSSDILKSGGYKLSALEIEAALLEHDAIAEVAVVGVPDETWGDRVTACIVLHPGATLTLTELRAWAKQRLAPYKVPRALALTCTLPRNAMGKLQKRPLVEALVAGRLDAEIAPDRG